MANIFVYIATEEALPSPASLTALAHGRRLATRLGATLHALIPTTSSDHTAHDDVITTLAAHGADHVLWVTHDQLTSPALYATHGIAVLAANHRFPAQVIIVAADAAGLAIASPLAAQLGATYAPFSTLRLDDESVVIEHHTFRQRHIYSQTIAEAPRPLVLLLADTLPPDDPPGSGNPITETTLDLGGDLLADAGFRLVGSTRSTDQPSVTLGGGSALRTPEAFAKLGQLAETFGADLVVTASACEQGLAPESLRAGLGGRSIETDLYLAFGVSGSARHLAALSSHTTVVAVHDEAQAPIFQVARFGLLACAAKTVEALLARAKDTQ